MKPIVGKADSRDGRNSGAFYFQISMFLNSLNHFRAIAIAFIVTGHCSYLAAVSFETFPERVFSTLVNGGTALFVFISGFLFHYIFYKRYRFKKFMSGKLKKVLLPYTLLSVLPIVNSVLSREGYYSAFAPTGDRFADYIVPAFKYYITGSFLIAYWYIPFVMLLFLMSPLHIAFIKLSFKWQSLITFLLFVVALFLHRPVENILIVQSVVYFTPVYLFGIMCSEHQTDIYAKLKSKEIYLLLLAILIAVFQVSTGHTGSYEKPPFAYNGIDLMLIQKMLLCLFFMVWLHRFENVKSKYINILASASFAIYFMHGFFTLVGYKLFSMFDFTIESPWRWYPIVTISVILSCILLALGLKRLIPNYSRYIIGY